MSGLTISIILFVINKKTANKIELFSKGSHNAYTFISENFAGAVLKGLSGYSVLKMNFFNKLLPSLSNMNKEMRIVMLGLKAAGKTAITQKLRFGELVTTTVAPGFTVEGVEYKNISFAMWDVGGNRQFWGENAQVLIFVVDSTNREEVNEARAELDRLLNEDGLRDAILLLYANKQDLPNAMNPVELTDNLGLQNIRNHKWHTQPCSAITGDGLYEGFTWINSQM